MRLLLRSESGASLIELALVMPMLLLFLFGVVDFGRAYFLQLEVAGAADAGATYGSQYATDAAGITSAAKLDAPDVPGGVATTSSWGCECSDGTSVTPSCSSAPSCPINLVYYVTVTTSATYHPLFPWPGIPSPISLSASTTMRSGSTSSSY
jgi:Flp pilus assembly protein TadG